MADLLSVRVNTPERVLWEGTAVWVSSKNSRGSFDILPFHTNFVTILENETIRINTGKDIKEYTFPNSVIYVHSNHVYIYANIWTGFLQKSRCVRLHNNNFVRIVLFFVYIFFVD